MSISTRPALTLLFLLSACATSLAEGPETRTPEDVSASLDAWSAESDAPDSAASAQRDTSSDLSRVGPVLAGDDAASDPAHEDEASDPILGRDRCDDGEIYPMPEWSVAAPEAHGLDGRDLALAAEYARENDSHCLVVARHGEIVGEWYFGSTEVDTPVKSWSVGKSYAATVTGLALDQGYLGDVRDAVSSYVPQWTGLGRDDITIHHLMSMTSGLAFDLVADNLGMVMADDMTRRAIRNGAPRRPGYAWEYNNHTVQMIEPVLENAVGLPPDEFAQAELFEPLGMNAVWDRDSAGNPAMYMNVIASCRDHARLGQLYLRRGCWDGQELLSEEFVIQATSPSSAFNQGYGYWWWLNGQEPLLDSVTFQDKGHTMHPFAPDDAFCAIGLGNQMVEVIPSLDMVIVRMGPAPHENLRLWLTDRPRIMADLQSDGEQRVHNGVLERVLAAVQIH
jgi:CubicO group peptidase (beta-lactamase class C family)